ncbi:MAG: HEAT repeat domain-containing protein [Egibacteraceae bacterium]
MTEGATYLDRPVAHWATLLGSDDALDRRLGAHALGEIGPGAHDQVGGLAVALADPVPFVRVWAAAGLARVDPQHSAVIPALVEATGAEQAFVRSLAAWTLGRLGRERGGSEPALAALRRLRADDDPSVRAEAELALVRVTPHP